uniref:3'-5' exonuclease domain-containing protein n=1 Tax=Heterorhabditis bacteriophora TaxID=37862 RepID=A0A1I7XKN6_HETBA
MAAVREHYWILQLRRQGLLDAIVHYGDRYYLIAEDYLTDFMEYKKTLLSPNTIQAKTDGVQKLFFESPMLLSKHRNLLGIRQNDATQFNNAHKIYEILVAGGIHNELERTSSIANWPIGTCKKQPKK